VEHQSLLHSLFRDFHGSKESKVGLRDGDTRTSVQSDTQDQPDHLPLHRLPMQGHEAGYDVPVAGHDRYESLSRAVVTLLDTTSCGTSTETTFLVSIGPTRI
jgi:hypothetical protein